MNWKVLSIFGKNKIINSSYIYLIIVPIIATILKDLPNQAEFTLFDNDIKLNLFLPFRWKLFFFAACCFTIGSLLYWLFAPRIIKENKSLAEFLENRRNLSHLASYISDLTLFRPHHSRAVFIRDKFTNTSSILPTYLGMSYGVAISKRDKGFLRNIKYSFLKIVSEVLIFIDRLKLKAKVIDDCHKILEVNHDLIVKKDQNITHEVEPDHLYSTFWLVYNFSKTNRILPLGLANLFYLSGFFLIGKLLYDSVIKVLGL